MIEQQITQEQQQVDNSNLETFDTTNVTADLSAHNKRGIIQGYVNAKPQETEETDVTAEVDETEVSEQESTETDADDSVFAQQFQQVFGIKPNEAAELVNSLQSFRDEQTLMRQWQVSPDTYDERMTQVREFYNGLPEEGRQQFNTVEGAAAIWEHLQKNGQANESTTRANKRTTANSRVKRAPVKPSYDFTTRQIKAMPKEEYQQKLPAIVKAFQSGRVLDN